MVTRLSKKTQTHVRMNIYI